MKKILFIILLLVSGLAYAQNPIYGKKVVGIDSLVSDTIRARTQSYPFLFGVQVDNIAIDGATITSSTNVTIDKDLNIPSSSGDRLFLNSTGTQIAVYDNDKGQISLRNNAGQEGGTNTLLGTNNADTDPALNIESNINGQDSGTDAALEIQLRNGNAAISTRPLLRMYNYTSEQLEVDANGNWDFGNNDIDAGAYDGTSVQVSGSVTAGTQGGANNFTAIGNGNIQFFKVGAAGNSTIELEGVNGLRFNSWTDSIFFNNEDVVDVGSIRGTNDLVSLKDSVNINGSLRMNGNRITQVATPTQSTDAANKAYVDANSNTGSTGNFDEINDQAGTGAPDFPNGLTLSGGSDVLDTYQDGVVAGNGDLSGGDFYFEKIGNAVVITWESLSHTSATSAASSSGLVPSAYRPTNEITNVYEVTGSVVRKVTIATDGTVTFNYYDWAGAGFSRGATDVGSITYSITP